MNTQQLPPRCDPKAVPKAPHSTRWRDGRASRDHAERLECGAFSAAFQAWQRPATIEGPMPSQEG